MNGDKSINPTSWECGVEPEFTTAKYCTQGQGRFDNLSVFSHPWSFPLLSASNSSNHIIDTDIATYQSRHSIPDDDVETLVQLMVKYPLQEELQ